MISSLRQDNFQEMAKRYLQQKSFDDEKLAFLLQYAKQSALVRNQCIKTLSRLIFYDNLYLTYLLLV